MGRAVTQRYKHGYCPDDMCFVGGRLLRDGKTLDTPEEEDVFREMGLAFVPPEERNIQ